MSAVELKCQKELSEEREFKNKNSKINYELQIKDYSQEDFEKDYSILTSKLNETIDFLKLDPNKTFSNFDKLSKAAQETSHFEEFTTKLGHVKSPGDISVMGSERTQLLGRNKTSSNMESKVPKKKCSYSYNISNERITDYLVENQSFEEQFRTKKQYPVPSFEQSNINNLRDSSPNDNGTNKVLIMDPQCLTYRTAIKNASLMEPIIPPILNESIKYIRVSSNDFNKNEFRVGFFKKELSSHTFSNEMEDCPAKDSKIIETNLSHDATIESFKFDSKAAQIDQKNDTEKETVRILISGHLTRREKPIFIIHKTYISSSTLIKDSIDFRAHKQQGEVDISITGKFFNDNILIENDKGHPSALDLKSHRFLIDRKSSVSQDSFKEVFNLGFFDAILEGEFVANSETLQFIPIVSLEVLKHEASEKAGLNKVAAVFESGETNVIDSLKDKSYETLEKKQDNTTILNHSNFVLDLINTKEEKTCGALKNIKARKLNNKPRTSKLTKWKESLFSFFCDKGSDNNQSQCTKSFQNSKCVRRDNKEKYPRHNEETKLEEDLIPKQISTKEISETNSIKNSRSKTKIRSEEKQKEKKSKKKK